MSISSGTRLSLLERALLRDERAWAELVDLYSPLIVRWCQRLSIGPEATADCIQEVFAAVARALDTYRAPGSAGAFRSWLWTITRNKLRDAARRDARHVAPTGGSTAYARLSAVPDPDQLPMDEPSQADDVRWLTQAALKQIESAFEPRSWQAFWRTAVDGISTAAVAQELSLTPAAVRQARSRIMRRLRQQLGDLG